MIKEVSIVHPYTNDIITKTEMINVVALDARHAAYRNNVGKYCVACFDKQIIDASTQSSMSLVTGIEYIECYACKAKMEFKEVE